MYQILPEDKMFVDSPDPGPDCICSRCGNPITDETPIRAQPVDDHPDSIRYEYRYHPGCVGMYASDSLDMEDIFDEFEIE